MTALNEIPDYLKSPRNQRGVSIDPSITWGIAVTTTVAAIVGVVLYECTRHFPSVTYHWLLSCVGAFLTTFLLFAVMHATAGIRQVTNLIVVVLASLLVLVKYIALLASQVDSIAVSVSPLAQFDAAEFVWLNFTSWCGVALAAAVCRNGNFAFEDLLDILMMNPLTGRRQ